MVSDDAVRANAAFIVTQLKGSNQPNPLVALTHALSTLGPRMPRERQSEAAAWITSILCKTDYPPQQGLLAVGLGPFTSHLENREVQPAVSCLTKSIDQSHGADLEYLAEGLDAIREHVPAETFKHAADVLIKEMNVTTRDDVVGELAKGIAALKVSLTDDQLRTIEGAMVERPRITTQLYDFYDSPGSVGQILKNQSASSSSRQIVIGQIMKVFKESDDPLQLVALARILNVSGGPLSGPDTNALADKIVKSFKSMPGFAGELGAEIAPLVSTNLSSAEISKYRAGLVQRAKDVASDSDPDRLAGFVKAYGALGGYSSSDDDTLIQLVLSKMSSVPKPTGASKSSVEERIQGRISLQEALAELDSHADDVANRAQLNALLSLLRDGTQPSCDAINPFIRKNTIPETADVLKWPTCSPEARDHILTKLEQAVGEHFESAQDGAYESRLREFVAWSRRNGLDVSGPPRFESKKVD